jgi:cytidylate kinase
MIIAIDGPSGTGKSTVAKGVAGKLGFTFFDTGAMYRSVAWKILQEGIDPSDAQKVVAMMPLFHFQIRADDKGDRLYFVGEHEVTHLIRTREISTISSQIAAYPEVRKCLVKIQRKFGHSCNAVFEGRDMGTVVFPDADLKIFLTARSEVRAMRRYKELLNKFPDLRETLSVDEIFQEMEERDKSDATRAISPLRQAPDAVLIDTSDLSASQAIDKIVRLTPKVKGKFPSMKFSYWLVYSLARLFFKIFFRLRIYGLKHFRPGPGLIAANHSSFYDPPVLSISCPEEVHFLGKGSLFRVPLLGWLIRILNTHPVSKGGADIQTLKLMIQLLKEGKKLIVFPEGSRSEGGQLQPLERGIAFLAQKSNATIFPAYLRGTFEAWPRSRKFPKLVGKITCVFGTPIEWDDFEGLPKRESEEKITARLEEAIRALQAWLESGAHGEPP